MLPTLKENTILLSYFSISGIYTRLRPCNFKARQIAQNPDYLYHHPAARALPEPAMNENN